MQMGMNMAIDEANAAGGVDGTKITGLMYDDQSQPDQARTVVSKLIGRRQRFGNSWRSRFEKQHGRSAGLSAEEGSNGFPGIDQSTGDTNRRLYLSDVLH